MLGMGSWRAIVFTMTYQVYELGCANLRLAFPPKPSSAKNLMRFRSD
jgi:hypothetical protein